jgi:hypothetical protein
MRTAAGRGPRAAALAAMAAVLALALAVLPWVLGGRAHGAYKQMIADLLAALPPGTILTEHYERGWFRSHASTELALGPETGTPLRVRIDSRVDQGPLHWLHSGLPPALARVESRVDLLDQQVAPPLLVVTDLGLDGGTSSRLHLPAIDQPGNHETYRLRSGALTGRLRLEPGSGGVELDLPLAELTGPQGTIARVEALRLTSSLRSQPADPGSGSGRALMGSAIGSAIGSAQAGGPAAGAGTPGGEPPPYPRDARLDLRLTISATTLSLGGESLREPRLGIIAEGLAGAAVLELTTGLQALSSGEAPQAVRRLLGAALLAQWLPRLAAGQPRILIDPARVDTTEGPLAVRLSLAMEPTRSGPDPSGPQGGTSPTDPRAWLGALMAEGEIELPEALARRWLTPGDAGTRPGELGTPRSATLQSWLDGRWVSQRDGRIASAFRLADGLLSVNGKTVPLFGLPSTRLR